MFDRIYSVLPNGGIFVNYDMFNADSNEMTECYNRYWENSVLKNELSKQEIEHCQQGRVIDKECSVNEEAFMLKNAGFKNVHCVFSNLKFAVIFD